MVKRLVALASLSALVTAGTLVATATSASAVPTNCTITYGSNWARSLCTGGTGEHQVNMLQKHFATGVGYIPCPGNWAPVGQYSYAPCAYHTIINVWIERRG